MSTQRLTRICLILYRKAGMSKEEFSRHWSEHHGPIVSEWLIRHGIIKYNQFHVSARSSSMGPTSGAAPDFDGIVEFIVRRYEDMEAAYADPEYQEKIRPDEMKFLEPDRAILSVGEEVLVIDNGKYVLD